MSTQAQVSAQACGPLRPEGQFGPYDYRKDRDKLNVVESFHFTTPVEALIGGQSGPLAADIDYTLRAFPNHHRALIAMMRLGARLKVDKPDRANYSVECYFERAIRFAPDDPIARMIYAQFLGSKARIEQADTHLALARKMGEDNALTQYNIGLVYLELKQYEQALTQAHMAMQMGVPRTELKTALVAVGKWVDPPADAASASAADPSASSPRNP